MDEELGVGSRLVLLLVPECFGDLIEFCHHPCVGLVPTGVESGERLEAFLGSAVGDEPSDRACQHHRCTEDIRRVLERTVDSRGTA